MRPRFGAKAPARELFLLMPIGAKESNARGKNQPCHFRSNEIGNNDDRDHQRENEDSVLSFWLRQRWTTVFDFDNAEDHSGDQDRQDDKYQSDERPPAPAEAAHDLRTAANADIRLLGNLRVAMRAYQRLHAHTITPPISEYERISQATLLRRFELRLSRHCRECPNLDSAPAWCAATSPQNPARREAKLEDYVLAALRYATKTTAEGFRFAPSRRGRP